MIRSFYKAENGEIQTDLSRQEMTDALNSDGVLWVDFFRATREEQSVLDEVFHFHPLAIEDCLRPVHRPKVDSFEDHLFLIIHGPDLATRRRELRTLEVKTFLGKNFVVTYHRVPVRSIVHALELCERSPSQTLGRGPDFLLYTLLDEMAENYAPILSRSEAQIVEIEEAVLKGEARDEVLPELTRLRRGILSLRRVISAQRDAVSLLARQGEPLVRKRAEVYFRDIVGMYQRVLEQIEAMREALGGVRDTHLSMSSNRANEIMKTLTVMATIMLPPTLISGIYGMNFKIMPEVDWVYGYPLALTLMGAIIGGMLFYFRRKKWL
jgi:magnesium transporter